MIHDCPQSSQDIEVFPRHQHHPGEKGTGFTAIPFPHNGPVDQSEPHFFQETPGRAVVFFYGRVYIRLADSALMPSTAFRTSPLPTPILR